LLVRPQDHGTTADLLLLSVGAYALIWAAGFLFVVAPGGAGVRAPPPGSRRTARLSGRVSDADLAVLLARATAVVVPNRSEGFGFGLRLLEPMAAGTPVVTSDAAALVEVGAGAARVTPWCRRRSRRRSPRAP
jgi:glycosyltransferase involved in cell wall biosynthesis